MIIFVFECEMRLVMSIGMMLVSSDKMLAIHAGRNLAKFLQNKILIRIIMMMMMITIMMIMIMIMTMMMMKRNIKS